MTENVESGKTVQFLSIQKKLASPLTSHFDFNEQYLPFTHFLGRQDVETKS